MATDQEVRKIKEMANVKREAARGSLDQLRVFNPLKTPFTTLFDGFTHVAPPGVESTFPRYIAEKMMDGFSTYMINKDADDAIASENKKRMSKGWKEMNVYEETLDFISSKNLLTNNRELIKKYTKMMYRGVSQEYGLDVPEAIDEPRDRRPQFLQVLEELDTELGTKFPEPTEEEVTSEEIKVKKEDLLEEIE